MTGGSSRSLGLICLTITALFPSVLHFVLLEEQEFNEGYEIAVGCVEGDRSRTESFPANILCDRKDERTEHHFR